MDFAKLLVFTEESGRNYAWRQIMSRSEKRKYRRLPMKLDLSCRKAGSPAEKSYTGYTVNVSPGGLYFETETETFKPGNLLKVELSIPPTVGLLESGGRFSGFARVLRTYNTCESPPCGRYGIAVKFSQSLKLRT